MSRVTCSTGNAVQSLRSALYASLTLDTYFSRGKLCTRQSDSRREIAPRRFTSTLSSVSNFLELRAIRVVMLEIRRAMLSPLMGLYHSAATLMGSLEFPRSLVPTKHCRPRIISGPFGDADEIEANSLGYHDSVESTGLR